MPDHIRVLLRAGVWILTCKATIGKKKKRRKGKKKRVRERVIARRTHVHSAVLGVF